MSIPLKRQSDLLIQVGNPACLEFLINNKKEGFKVKNRKRMLSSSEIGFFGTIMEKNYV